jgi:hypothetical protein
MKNITKLIRKSLYTLPVLMLVVFSSCYQDYGLDTNNYDVVVTLYDNTYNFQNVTKYYLADTLIIGNSIDASYKNAIFTSLNRNLAAQGWTKVTAPADANVIISAGVTSTTTYVDNGGGCWWDYYGYYWCYPSYGYDYTYTTGTLFVLMNDRASAVQGSNNQPEWVAAINGLADQGNVVSRINTTVDQAFKQSPYLKSTNSQ